MKLSNVIRVNERFKNSINLQLDINKHDVVEGYIPTSSSVKIMKRYLCNILNDTSEKSTLLIGPYGKGKSHLLIILLSIVSYGEENEEIIKRLIDRVHKVDEEAASYIDRIRKEKRRLLPVIISNTQMDANQALIIALNDALERANLKNLKPKTYYTEACNVIENWKKNYPSTYERFIEELSKRKYKFKTFVADLENCDAKALDTFCLLYPLLTSGSEFHPMINTEVINLYKQINHEIQAFGYEGIFVVFDEFSKYIEGHDRDTISRDFRIIQEFCELCNESHNEQLHSLFVVHKSIKEYDKVLPMDIINAFKGIEGRLDEIMFCSSKQNNYELIKNAIVKNENYDFLKTQLVNSMHYDATNNLPIFEALFDKEDFENIVVDGCFPLTPVSAYLLINICELVAQNERTLFTFISKDEPHSLARFIREHSDGMDYFIYSDRLYDYFKSSFRNELSSPYIHNEWLKTEDAIARTSNENDKKVLKALGVINIINKYDEFPPYTSFVMYASGLSKQDIDQSIQRLLDKQIIGYRNSSEYLFIKNRNAINIEGRIKKELSQLPLNFDYVRVLQDNRENYVVHPRMHNQNNCINRFFEVLYLNYDNFIEMSDSSVLFKNSFSDGKIVYIFSSTPIDVESCRKKIEELHDSKLVFVISECAFVWENEVRELFIVQKLKNEFEHSEDEAALFGEICSIEEDMLSELQKNIENLYGFDSSCSRLFHYKNQEVYELEDIKAKQINHYISEICDSCYKDTPIINNEMINRNNLSSQIKNARNNLIQAMLSEADQVDAKFLCSTSPEGSIYRSTLIYTGVGNSEIPKDSGISKVMGEIQNFVKQCDGQKKCFKELYERLLAEPYGMRMGTIPIYIALVLRGLNDTPIIYLNSKEVTFDATILSNINESPSEYYLLVEAGTKEKMEYLDCLNTLFIKHIIEDCTKNRMEVIVTGMQRWMQSLSTLSCNYDFSEQLGLTEGEYKALKRLRSILKRVECNSRELLFVKITEMFPDESLKDCAIHISNIKKVTDSYLNQRLVKLIATIKNMFEKDSNENLKTVLNAWYSNQNDIAKNTLLSGKITEFISYISNLDTFNEIEIANRICKIVTGMHVENWVHDLDEELERGLIEIKSTVENFEVEETENNQSQRITIESSGKEPIVKYYDSNISEGACYFLKNALNDTLEEFGDSVEINEKVSILVQLISELVK